MQSRVTPPSISNDEGYQLSGQIRTFNILPAEINVSADPISLVYGETIPEIEYSYSGFAYSETASVLTDQPTVDIPSNLAPGTYSFTPRGAKALNYKFAYTPVSVTVASNKHELSWELA